MDESFIRKRMTALRMRKGVSEYKMSIDLGHSKSYIQSISSGRAFPSMSEFLYICEYLGISPREFFDESLAAPEGYSRLCYLAHNLSERDISILINMAERMNGNNNQ